MSEIPQDEEKPVTRRELQLLLEAHAREHALHEKAHDREHILSSEALNKADSALDKRLEGMNEFRAQLQSQAATFVNRGVFDTYTKEQQLKNELNSVTSNEKYEALFKAFLGRHESDVNSLKTEIQLEREYRKTLEGSINTWKWLMGFLGASGVAGVILLFATRAAG